MSAEQENGIFAIAKKLVLGRAAQIDVESGGLSENSTEAPLGEATEATTHKDQDKSRRGSTPLKTRPTAAQVRKGDPFISLPLARIVVSPMTPERNKSVDRLKHSLAIAEIYQPPGVVPTQHDQDLYECVWGASRIEAARKSGMTEIFCHVLERVMAPEVIRAHVELWRSELHPLDEAELLAVLKRECDFTNLELARELGCSVAAVTSTLSINKLPGKLREQIRMLAKRPSRDLLIELSRIEDEAELANAFGSLMMGTLTRAALRGKKGARAVRNVGKHLTAVLKRLKALLPEVWAQDDAQPQLREVVEVLREVEARLQAGDAIPSMNL